jgi:hypothetical protein
MSQLPSAADLYSQALQQLQGYGSAAKSALQQAYQSALGTGKQMLASSGLAGTTIAPSMMMGYMRQYQQSLGALHDSLAQTGLGVLSSFGFGGIQSQQAQQGLDISKANLGVSQQYAGIAQSQLALQQGQYQATYGEYLKNQQALANAGGIGSVHGPGFPSTGVNPGMFS